MYMKYLWKLSEGIQEKTLMEGWKEGWKVGCLFKQFQFVSDNIKEGNIWIKIQNLEEKKTKLKNKGKRNKSNEYTLYE